MYISNDLTAEVTVLIPTRFDNRYILELCLKTISKYTTIPYNIIVGDAGVEGEAVNFLDSQRDIEVVKCPDQFQPKPYLVKQSRTPYFLILHDDVQILKSGWLKKRLRIMKDNPQVGILGVIVLNQTAWWKRYFILSPVKKRFLPLAMMVNKQAQDELELSWSKFKGLDGGTLAYLQFIKQNKWKFKKYKFNKDLYHWGEMTWILRGERISMEADRMNAYLNERHRKIEKIKEILNSGNY